jgi:hypothetical protein
MNADDLRAVAADIRQKANGFIVEEPVPPRVEIDSEGTCDQCSEERRLVASYPDGDSEPWLCAPCAAYTDHLAAWERQPVALAVADWLDLEAERLDHGRLSVGFDRVPLIHISGAAEAFVRAWRGES